MRSVCIAVYVFLLCVGVDVAVHGVWVLWLWLSVLVEGVWLYVRGVCSVCGAYVFMFVLVCLGMYVCVVVWLYGCVWVCWLCVCVGCMCV